MKSVRPLTILAIITTSVVVVAQGASNFAASSITSDGSGTKYTQFSGSSPNGGGVVGIGSRIGPSPVGSGGGVVVSSSNGPGQSGGAVFTGTSSGGNGGSVGIFSRTGPGGATHTVVGPDGSARTYFQPQGRFGSPNSYYNSYPYPSAGGAGGGYYNDHNDYNYGYEPYPGAGGVVAQAGPGTFASAGAGGGAFAGASAGGIGAFAGGLPDYYG